MKRCPQCGREYDTSMMFCLDDGAELLYGPVAARSVHGEPANVVLPGQLEGLERRSLETPTLTPDGGFAMTV